MAKIVAGFGVPHNPRAPEIVRTGAPGHEVGALYGAVADEVRKAEVDVPLQFENFRD